MVLLPSIVVYLQIKYKQENEIDFLLQNIFKLLPEARKLQYLYFKICRQDRYNSQSYLKMDLSKQIEKVGDFLSKNNLEIACIAVSTALYQIYQRLKQNQTTKQTTKKVKFDPVASNAEFKRLRRVESSFKIPNAIIESQNSLIDQIQHLYNPACKIQKVPHLVIQLGLKHIPSIKSPLLSSNKQKNQIGGQGFIPEKSFVYRGSYVLSKNLFHQNQELANSTTWLLAGPRKFLYFKPSTVRAAIVTCGGLCPGLNVVIREIYTTLVQYGCQQVWGVKYGYMGFYSGPDYWIKLYEKFVRELQYLGGTILGSSRGGFDADKIINALVEKGINQVYVIGGDGTHRGISVLTEELKKRNLEITIVGVPKTIDNDIPIIDKSFGFQTAVAESIRAVRSAYVEAIGVDYGIGLVRLMGRDAGFIAMQATNASRDVNICLVPQFKFDLYGPHGVFEYIYEELKLKRHLVIVVAEGAGSGVRDLQKLTKGVEKDQSGNIKMPDIGVFLKTEIINYLKEKKMNATLKYIDPAYMIRTVGANSYDRKLCAHLAASAVHGAMAGFTAFTVGHINQNVAMIPISSLGKPNRITESNRAWQRVLAYTGQPSFQNK